MTPYKITKPYRRSEICKCATFSFRNICFSNWLHPLTKLKNKQLKISNTCYCWKSAEQKGTMRAEKSIIFRSSDFHYRWKEGEELREIGEMGRD